MIRESVRKPYTVLVGVLMIIVLGIVSFTKMKTDLIPSINIPYVTVITTYPGAAPERVKTDVTEVIENTLGTMSGVDTMTSQSGENFSMVLLKFTDDTDVEQASSKVTRLVDQLQLPESAGKPMVMELSMDMMATMYVGVTKDKTDIYDLTTFTEDKIIPELKRQEGVASVSETGGVTKSVEVRLSQDKIDEVNNDILGQVNRSLTDAKKKLDDSKRQLASGKSKISSGQRSLKEQKDRQAGELAKYSKKLNEALATKAAYQSQVNSLKAQIAGLKAEKNQYKSSYNKLNQAIKGIYAAAGSPSYLPANLMEAAGDEKKLAALKQALITAGQQSTADALTKKTLTTLVYGVNTRTPQIDGELNNLKTKLATAEAAYKQISSAVKQAESQYEKVESGKITAAAAFGSSSAQLSAAKDKLTDGEEKLKEAEKTYRDSAKAARENANLDALLSMDTLSGLLSAQNFDMPAGYISKDHTQYLLKVGDELSNIRELKNLVLTKVKGVGDIRLSDVADITMIDDSETNYARINGKPAQILSVSKASTAYTSDVSDNAGQAIRKLEKKYKGLHFMTLMDQGDYIDVIVEAVMQNLIWGAILAVIVLLIFLWDFRPTIIVGISIPLSVLFALVLMYFKGITLNAISLSGLSLGIGMLVDNSIVSIENIYRLRSKGIPAAKAAVQGAKQIAGAIAASTLTTICVFLPLLFTEGLTRQLLGDMSLTISFSLIASLVVALTVVPAMSSSMLKNSAGREHPLFDRLQDTYGHVLNFCLKVKVLPLLLAVVLLVFSGAMVLRMGIVIMPDMASNQLSASITMPDNTEDKDRAKTADQIIGQIQGIKGVKETGAMASGGSASRMGISVGNKSLQNMQFYIMLDEDYTHENKTIAKEIEKILSKKDLKTYSVSASNMDMSAMYGSGLSVKVKGEDADQLLAVSEDVMKLVKKNGAFENVSNGQEEGATEIRLTIDKNKAARKGLTVAQIYQQLSQKLTTSKDSTTLHTKDGDYEVSIVDETDTIAYSKLMQTKITATVTGADGSKKEKEYRLFDFAKKSRGQSLATIMRENQGNYIEVTADAKEGENTTVASRSLERKIAKMDLPDGISVSIGGEADSTNEIVKNMLLMVILGFIFIYLVMVAQFQSLLSPFIVIFTVPLAFTGGLIALLITGEQLSILSMMGFVILMGVIVNNGIVYVDYVNQLRLSGMDRHEALVVAGKTRMRPILMTALTTIMAMLTTIFSDSMGSDMGRGMSIVVVGGLIYATLMTLLVVPVLYDLMFKREVHFVDVDSDLE